MQILKPKKKAHKYGAKKTMVDNIMFDSKAEARRYGQLKMQQMAGIIQNLERQPKYELLCPTKTGTAKVATYSADFKYTLTQTGEQIVEDVKGKDTPMSKRSRKHLLLQTGINVKIIK